MSYKFFKIDVAWAHKLKIVGWPSSIAFANPSELGVLEDLRRVRDDLRAGLIYFMALDDKEEQELGHELDAMRAANGGHLKMRKQRDDVGGKHVSAGRRDEESDDDEEDAEEDDDPDDDDDQEFSARGCLGSFGSRITSNKIWS
ncbi:hypothetical protein B0H10DRAFT_2246000 [Mycena sp. CBHHK59/15]|nr:hypothetical protein B0H10DRAFT_2246000 [Mycena sp. CBHHK59/15]